MYLADFSRLWGPIGLHHTNLTVDTIDHITVRGGIIHRIRYEDNIIPTQNDEVLCHWSSCTNLPSNNTLSFSSTAKLLIGGGTNEVENTAGGMFKVWKECRCKSASYAELFDPFELQTMIPSWKLDERSAQISGGAYVNVLYGHTWKFNNGWTLKDVIINNWVEMFKYDESHHSLPLYLDYFSVLDVSRCTGHARRISIWSLLRQEAVQAFKGTILDTKTMAYFDLLVKFFPATALATDVWKSVPENAKSTLKIVTRDLLAILRSTGVGEDGHLQVWDITSRNRVDGRKIAPNWRTMVKDGISSATFAVMTSSCIRTSAFPATVRSSLKNEKRIHGILGTIFVSQHPTLSPGESLQCHHHRCPPQISAVKRMTGRLGRSPTEILLSGKQN